LNRVLPTVRATRLAGLFRNASSLPILVECDDDGTYVAKLRGAAQGTAALVAEIVAAGIGAAMGIAIPDLVLVEFDAALAQGERDPEVLDVILPSAGLNLGVDFLPGSRPFLRPGRPVRAEEIPRVDPAIASRIVLFDAFVGNVDRAPRNPNLLLWHRRLYCIDHGAAIAIHCADDDDAALDPFTPVRDHVLLRSATALGAASGELRARVTPDAIAAAIARVPSAWLDAAQATRLAQHLERRLAAAAIFTAEAARAHAALTP
jgi:hypothetical protein